MNKEINNNINKGQRVPRNLKRKPWAIILPILVLVVVAIVAGLYYYVTCYPYYGTVKNTEVSMPLESVLTKEQAREDIDYVIEKFRKKHPAWLEEGNIRVSEVEARYREITEELTASVTVGELYTGLKYMISPLHDGHSYVGLINTEWKMIDNLSYVEDYGLPVKINGEDTSDVAMHYLDRTSYEIESVALDMFYNDEIFYDIGLMIAGVDVSEGVTFTYNINGVYTDIHHNFVSLSDGEEENYSSEEAEWVYYEIDEENDAAVLTLTHCRYDKHYKTVVQGFFENVDSAGVSDVIVDLRGNPGGDSRCANEFIRYLDVDEYQSWESDVRLGNRLKKYRNLVNKNKKLEPQYCGRVWVLTDRNTYSSAMDFTMLISDNKLGKVVGEASANLPDSYGDCLSFQTPNAKLYLSVSFKHWYRIDKTKAGQQIMPDYECDPEYALEKVYEVK